MSLLILFQPAGVAPPPPPPVQQQPGNVWEVYLCDRFGFPISNISRVCFGKQLAQTLNQPAMFTFWSPSNDGRVSSLHTDGNPYLMEGRAIRVYRNGTLVFAGHLWQIEDDGDGETVKTSVTCFDPLQWLSRRIARKMHYVGTALGTPSIGLCISNPGGVSWDKSFSFQIPAGAFFNVPAAAIARGMLNGTNDYDGFTGLDDYYLNAYYRPNNATPGLCTNQSEPSTPNASPTFSMTRISDMLTNLISQNNVFDLEVVPTDSDYYSSPSDPTDSTGATYQQAYKFGSAADWSSIRGSLLTKPWKTLALLRYWAPTRGTTQSNVIFGYATYPHNVAQVSYLTDLSNLTNYSALLSGQSAETAINLTSVQTYGAGMDVEGIADITDTTLLAALATEEATLGGNAKRTLSITPIGGSRTPLPFDNFNLGDTISVQAGSKLRGGFTGTQRVYGWTIDIGDDHTTETLSNLVTSPQTA